MTSYKDSPMSLKEIQFRLASYTSVIKECEKQINLLKKECESMNETMEQNDNNVVLEVFKNDLVFKQHIEHINDVLYIDSVEYNIINAKIVDGLDDVMIMLEVEHGDKKYVAIKWGIFYGDILKWQDMYKLIKIDGSALEISSSFNCKYNTYDHCYYLVSSINDSNKDYLFVAKKECYDEQPDEWEKLEFETQTEGTFYNFDSISLKNMKSLHTFINHESLLCLGSLDNTILSSLLVFNNDTNKYSSYVINTNTAEQGEYLDISNFEIINKDIAIKAL